MDGSYLIVVCLLIWFCLLLSPAESVEEQVTSTPSCTQSPVPISSQPTPRSDLFPSPPIEDCSATSQSRPTTPPPEPEQPIPSLSKEEEGEPQANSELKHRTAKKDLLEIDRFTICGNRIDWAAMAHVALNHSGKTSAEDTSAWLPANCS